MTVAELIIQLVQCPMDAIVFNKHEVEIDKIEIDKVVDEYDTHMAVFLSEED